MIIQEKKRFPGLKGFHPEIYLIEFHCHFIQVNSIDALYYNIAVLQNRDSYNLQAFLCFYPQYKINALQHLKSRNLIYHSESGGSIAPSVCIAVKVFLCFVCILLTENQF